MMRYTPNPVSSEPESQGEGASADADRAVVNGAGQAVSAVPASVPSAAHTPGPWKYVAYGRMCFFIQSAVNPIAPRIATVSYTSGAHSLHEADARVLAAAPELLAQLQFAIKLLDGLIGCRGTAQIEAMKATVAKALGK